MSDPKRQEEENEPETDETREPMLTPEDVTDVATKFRQEELAEEAAQGLDQLEGPDIKAVMHRDKEEAAPADDLTGEDEEKGLEQGGEKLDDLFDPPGYYDGDSDGPVSPADADVGVRDTDVEGPRRQVGEAAHNPPIGQAPKQGKEEEEEHEEND